MDEGRTTTECRRRGLFLAENSRPVQLISRIRRSARSILRFVAVCVDLVRAEGPNLLASSCVIADISDLRDLSTEHPGICRNVSIPRGSEDGARRSLGDPLGLAPKWRSGCVSADPYRPFRRTRSGQGSRPLQLTTKRITLTGEGASPMDGSRIFRGALSGPSCFSAGCRLLQLLASNRAVWAGGEVRDSDHRTEWRRRNWRWRLQ
jgi:hypothetical protein